MGIVARHQKLAFYGVPATGSGTTTYHRMTGFTTFSMNKNAKEYNRQYVDEPFSEADVVGFSPAVSYAFDQHTTSTVHTDIVSITNDEKIGDDAVRSIILVDTVSGDAIKRDYAVIPSSEGDNTNAYTYSGDFKCKGNKIKGTATSADDWQTVTFAEAAD